MIIRPYSNCYNTEEYWSSTRLIYSEVSGVTWVKVLGIFKHNFINKSLVLSTCIAYFFVNIKSFCKVILMLQDPPRRKYYEGKNWIFLMYHPDSNHVLLHSSKRVPNKKIYVFIKKEVAKKPWILHTRNPQLQADTIKY